MSTSSYYNLSRTDANRIISMFSAGASVRTIAAECGKSQYTVKQFLSMTGYVLSTEQRSAIREQLRAGANVEVIASEKRVPVEAVLALRGRIQRNSNRRLQNNPIIEFAKKGYSTKKIAEKTHKTIQTVRATISMVDLYDDQVASVCEMYCAGLTAESIAEELGIPKRRVLGMLSAAGKIEGSDRPEKPLIGFQRPELYPNRHGKKILTITEEKHEAIDLLRHGIELVRTADVEVLSDRRHELHSEVRSFIDTHGDGPLYDGRNLTTILEDVGFPRFPWRCDFERHLRTFEHSRKPYPEAVDLLLALAQRWLETAEKYISKINALYGLSIII